MSSEGADVVEVEAKWSEVTGMAAEAKVDWNGTNRAIVAVTGSNVVGGWILLQRLLQASRRSSWSRPVSHAVHRAKWAAGTVSSGCCR